MKKIHVSTVEQTTSVEVIYVNSNLISKAIKADIAAQNMLNEMMNEYCPCIKPITEAELDNDGNPVLDENGNTIEKPALDKNGNKMYAYSDLRMDPHMVEMFHKQIVPFLKELVDAFEE